MQIIDAHLDIAWNAAVLGRNLRLSVAELRRQEAATALPQSEGEITVSLPEFAAAQASVIFATLFVPPPASGMATHLPGYLPAATPYEAYSQALAQLAYYQGLEQAGLVTIIPGQAMLATTLQQRTLGLVLLMEGAEPILDPSQLAEWYALGLRIIGPAWRATRYCGGTGEPGPLTPLGCDLLDEMQRLKIALDLSHMAEQSFWQALERFHGPVLVSHANCRRYVPTDRQLSDQMIRAIVERDGVVGVVPYNRFLVAEWDKQKASVGLNALLRHIEHICQIAGDRQHIGIGSDFDGGFGRQSIPREMDSWRDLALIAKLLAIAGWNEQDIVGFMGGNWLRWLQASLPSV